jgi:hypothetical protein
MTGAEEHGLASVVTTSSSEAHVPHACVHYRYQRPQVHCVFGVKMVVLEWGMVSLTCGMEVAWMQHCFHCGRTQMRVMKMKWPKMGLRCLSFRKRRLWHV